jgi:nitroreductase
MTIKTIPPAASAGTDYLLAMMSTQRALRHFKPEPVSDVVLQAIITAATYAPSGKNTQPWAFVVITDAALRRQLGDLYREAWYETMPQTMLDPAKDRAEARGRVDWEYLGNHMGDAPALALVCTTAANGAVAAAGSIFPAIQNLLLAARAFGVGTCLTTVHRARETEIKALLNVPDEVSTVALIPMGYPERAFGPVLRRPVSEVLHRERW